MLPLKMIMMMMMMTICLHTYSVYLAQNEHTAGSRPG